MRESAAGSVTNRENVTIYMFCTYFTATHVACFTGVSPVLSNFRVVSIALDTTAVLLVLSP